MGYVVPRRTALIDFAEGHQYHGAEVRVYLDQPLSLVFEMDKLRGDGETEEMIRIFGDNVLKEWNVTNEAGAQVPASFDGLKTQPFPFVMELISQWQSHATQVDGPLVAPSANGSQSGAEPSTLTEMWSDAPTN